MSSEPLPGSEPLVGSCSEAVCSVSAAFCGSEEATSEDTDLDFAEREQVVLAELEEKLRWKQWLVPDYEQDFRGTRLAERMWSGRKKKFNKLMQADAISRTLVEFTRNNDQFFLFTV